MENKTNIEAERELLLKLRESVNYQDEFEWVEAELAALEAESGSKSSSRANGHRARPTDSALGVPPVRNKMEIS